MHSSAADNLEKLIVLISTLLNSSSAPNEPANRSQTLLTRIRDREPEILIQLLTIQNRTIQMATSAVLSDLLQDKDPLTRQNTIRFLLSTRTTTYLKPLVDYLQQGNQHDEIRSAAHITARIACSGPYLTTACVQHNAILAWRMITLLNGAHQGS